MASDAQAAIARGFRTLKIKVGINPSLDVERLIAVRQAVGKDIIIRADANQAWNAHQAVDLLQEIQSHAINLELIEQPVKSVDLEGLAYVTAHSPVPVVADESCFSPEDARKIYQEHLADMVNIKLMKCGGLHNALKIVQYAKEAGAQCMCTAVICCAHTACTAVLPYCFPLCDQFWIVTHLYHFNHLCI
jgi:L-alanine-DL-glutamate epimerase and related enzymes of enolase superfamily